MVTVSLKAMRFAITAQANNHTDFYRCGSEVYTSGVYANESGQFIQWSTSGIACYMGCMNDVELKGYWNAATPGGGKWGFWYYHDAHAKSLSAGATTPVKDGFRICTP